MNEQEEIIERLKALELEGGSHEMLSSIAKAIYKPTCGGWTIGACQVLRDTLVNLLSETDEEALREAYTKGREDGMGMANAKDAHAEYLRGRNDGYDEGWDAGFASADDWCAQHEDEMAEHGWVRLPKDADGEYIHIGDRMENNERVARIVLTDDSWEPSVYLEKLPNVLHEYFCNEISHYHKQPTVEDVLHELIGKALMLSEIDGENELVAEYAKRLTLRGDGE